MTDKPELAGQLKQVASASSASSSTANGGGDDGVNVHLGPPVLLLAAEPATTNEDDKAGGSGKPRAVGSTADGDLEKALELDGDVKLTRDESADERAARLEREERESRYLHGFRLATVFTAMLLSVFLIALDQTIVATALPVIVSTFNALDQVPFVISAYFLTQAPLILVYGQLLTIISTKWVFIAAVTIFEIGSLICGVAPNVETLIAGRGVAGVGAAGIFVSCLSLIAIITPIQKRPIFFGFFGILFGASSVAGPLLGGALTEHATWRWVFYINLPIGALAVVAILVWVKADPAPGIDKLEAKEVELHGQTKSTVQRLIGLDWLGAVLIVGITTCLILALQDGGIRKPWSAPSVVAELAVFAVLVVVVVAWEWYRRNSNSILPLFLFKDRSVVGASLESFMLMMVMLTAIYYLPIYYQAVKGRSPTESGIDIIPFMLSLVVASLVAGAAISKTGNYYLWMVLGPLLFAPAGGAMLYATTTPYTSSGLLIGAQILIGVGIGTALQQTTIAVQAATHDRPEVTSQAVALVVFAQLLGGSIGIAIAGSVNSTQIKSQLMQRSVPSDIISAVLISVDNIAALSGDLRVTVLEGYVKALTYVFIMAVPAGILAGGFASIIRPLNLKKIGGLEALSGGAA